MPSCVCELRGGGFRFSGTILLIGNKLLVKFYHTRTEKALPSRKEVYFDSAAEPFIQYN